MAKVEESNKVAELDRRVGQLEAEVAFKEKTARERERAEREAQVAEADDLKLYYYCCLIDTELKQAGRKADGGSPILYATAARGSLASCTIVRSPEPFSDDLLGTKNSYGRPKFRTLSPAEIVDPGIGGRSQYIRLA